MTDDTSQRDPACGSCLHWKTLTVGHTEAGRCRRYPPVAERSYGPLWPITMRSDWCGEFAAARPTIPPTRPPTDLPLKHRDPIRIDPPARGLPPRRFWWQ